MVPCWLASGGLRSVGKGFPKNGSFMRGIEEVVELGWVFIIGGSRWWWPDEDFIGVEQGFGWTSVEFIPEHGKEFGPLANKVKGFIMCGPKMRVWWNSLGKKDTLSFVVVNYRNAIHLGLWRQLVNDWWLLFLSGETFLSRNCRIF